MSIPTADIAAEIEWLKGVSRRYEIGVSEHERGALCEADARLLWGEMDDSLRSAMALAARADCAPLQDDLEELVVRLVEKKDRVREMF